ncbi:uncharacterized protein LOC116576698 [Mustela erminea]|uniref:uncharacterized protein LOC116576698 n=1 Tax=Mustela erminea TaxID=36723 RepID=UPI001386C929|nr:uncharacterized protein LOC116576698 [Mustela erminea]
MIAPRINLIGYDTAIARSWFLCFKCEAGHQVHEKLRGGPAGTRPLSPEGGLPGLTESLGLQRKRGASWGCPKPLVSSPDLCHKGQFAGSASLQEADPAAETGAASLGLHGREGPRPFQPSPAGGTPGEDLSVRLSRVPSSERVAPPRVRPSGGSRARRCGRSPRKASAAQQHPGACRSARTGPDADRCLLPRAPTAGETERRARRTARRWRGLGLPVGGASERGRVEGEGVEIGGGVGGLMMKKSPPSRLLN